MTHEECQLEGTGRTGSWVPWRPVPGARLLRLVLSGLAPVFLPVFVPFLRALRLLRVPVDTQLLRVERSTVGTARSASLVISKSSAFLKPAKPAMMFVGITCVAVLYFVAMSL